jgi:hypothetical protein
MSSLIASLKREGALVLYHDYRKGKATFADLSGNGNDGTPSNVIGAGGGIKFNDSNGYIQVADSPELQGDAWTLVFVGSFDRLERPVATNSRILSKRDAGGAQYMWIMSDVPDLRIYDGSLTRTLVADYRGARSLGITLEDGETPAGYADGLFVGNYGGTVTVAADDAPLFVGNFHSATRSMLNPAHGALIFNRILTAKEMAAVHGELMSMPGGEH